MEDQGKILILGLRQVDPENNPARQTERFFEKNWRADSVSDLIGNIEEHIEQIPEGMRFNLYYTACQCIEASGRQLLYQDIIPFDIDEIDRTVDTEEYVVAVCKALRTHRDQIGIIFSGNGLQVLVKTIHVITEIDTFEKLRTCYKAVCGRIANELFSAGLYCKEVDSSVWSPARLLRLPMTTNRKPWKGLADSEAYVINGKLEALDFDLSKESDLPVMEENESISPTALKKFPAPDTKAVLAGCKMIQHCFDNPEDISEPLWYGALSIVARLDNGRELCHDMSKNHSQYNPTLTDQKITQAMKASGPRTCINVCSMWEGCVSCEHWEQITSPILIQGDDYIKTEGTGFYHIVLGPNGEQKLGKPAYEDLIKYYHKKNEYVTDGATGTVFTWQGKHWEEQTDRAIEAFAYKHMSPKPSTAITGEFKARMELTNQVDVDWFSRNSTRKMNFVNGTLDLNTMEFGKHNTQDGFLSVLGYEYNAEALCPRFDQFMNEITGSDEQINNLLLEFAGYAFSGMPCIYAKALLLVGDGANGKSSFLDILQDCAGEAAYSTVSLGEINQEQHRARMYGKLFNMSEEVPKKALTESSTFKRIVTGGEVSYKVVYKPTFSAKNKTKLLNACNALPPSEDNSHGLYRRMLIVPFDQRFSDEDKDIHLNAKLKRERAGILNRIIQGYHRLVKQGHFTESATVADAGIAYELDNDRIYAWVKDYVVPDVNGTLPLMTAYNAYRDTCLMDGIPSVKIENKQVFTKSMISKMHYGTYIRGAKGIMMFKGVSLSDNNNQGDF